MLSLMRKHAQSWLIKLTLGAIVIVFIFWGVGSYRAKREAQVALVNGDAISLEEFRNAYENLLQLYRKQLRGVLDDKLIKALNLKQKALDQLINQKLILQEATRLQLQVTDEELASYIQKLSPFQTNGRFDVKLYHRMLQRYRITPEEFEISERKRILTDRVQELIHGLTKVSDAEAFEVYRWGEEKVNLEYVVFRPEKYKNVSVTRDEVKEYFLRHKERYRTPPMVKVRYIRIAFKDFEDPSRLTDKEVRDYYDKHIQEFEKKKILFTEAAPKIRKRLAIKAARDLAFEKADTVYERIYTTNDMTEVAREEDLKVFETDYFTRTGSVKGVKDSRRFISQAFKLEKDGFSNVVELSDGYYILQLLGKREASIPKLSEVRKRVRKDIIKERKDELARKDAEKFLKDLSKGGDLKKEAKKYGLKVKTTGFFKRNSKIPGIGFEPDISEQAFQLTKLNPLPTGVIKGRKGFYVISFKGRQDAKKEGFIKKRDEIKARIRARKQVQVFYDWLSYLRKRSEISIQEGFLD